MTATGTLLPSLIQQFVRSPMSATGTNKAVGPATGRQVLLAAFAQRTAQRSRRLSPIRLEALNVMDFEEAARHRVLPVHWAHLASGVDDDATLRANCEGFKHVQLRPRRLRDATKVDVQSDLFGIVYNRPIFTCPTSGEKCLHPDGELAVARGWNR